MKFLNFDRVLCIAPHPDDVEYSMAGTILKHTDTIFDVLCLTQGGDCDDTTDVSRLNEVRASWQVSGASNVNLFFTDMKFLKECAEDSWINYIERTMLDKHTYDCICTTSDTDSHFEHVIVSNFGWPLTRVRAISLIEYYSPSTLQSWTPNVFIDIADQYNTKVTMLKEFVSQSHRSYFDKTTLDGFHTNFQCSKKGVKMVEQFNLKQVFI